MKSRQDIVNQSDQELLFQIDPIFLEIHEEYGSPPNWKRDEGFVSLCRIILEQQVSLESGKATYNKLSERLEDFTPSRILELTDEEFRESYVSRQKARYLRELSLATTDGRIDFDKLPSMSFVECRETLLSMIGIGNWTADIYQMICLQEKNIFPPGDVAIINSVRHLTKLDKVEDIVEYSKKWEPLKSLASYYFWHHHLCKSGRTVVY